MSPAAENWWQILLHQPLALALLLIFLTAIISTLVVARMKDKCLKLLHNHHVTYLTKSGRAIWGDLVVYPEGIELQFDAPYTTRRKLVKSSVLVYASQLSDCLALCRLDEGLTDAERKHRQHQIHCSFNPSLFRRVRRWVRNMVNTLRDAFNKSFSTILGQVEKAKPSSIVMTSHKGSVEKIGHSLLGAVAHACEPILEGHIGKPVIVTLSNPDIADQLPLELPGYLVDYTDKYLAIFNVEHNPREQITVDITGPVAKDQFQVAQDERHITGTCTGSDLLLVQSVRSGSMQQNLQVALMPESSMDFPRPSDHAAVRLDLAVT